MTNPLLSVILTTRDRPNLLAIALDCYRRQTHAPRELLVVDDGDSIPVDPQIVAGAGGRLIRAESDTPLGTKLNLGVRAAHGTLCHKMDDDDWYAPRFLQTMVSAMRAGRTDVCRPTIGFAQPYLFFDVARWQIRRGDGGAFHGGTLVFGREDWEERPFRNLWNCEDVWFVHDHVRAGVDPVAVDPLENFLAVRHAGGVRDRGHSWTREYAGQSLDDHLPTRPLYGRRPDELIPEPSLSIYRGLRRDILAASRPTE